MNDSIDRPESGPYDPGIGPRVARLEDGMQDVQSVLARLEPAVTSLQADVGTLKTDMAAVKIMVARMEARLEAVLPHLATKADLAEKPSKTYMWGILAVLLAAYACGLAAVAVLR